MAVANYEIVIAATNDLAISGDVDALGSILIITPNNFTLEGSVEAGGVETFHFITEDRAFVDGGWERVRIEAPNITVDGGIGIEGADESDEDTSPDLAEGDTYPLGAQIVASGLIELITTGGIKVANAGELIVRHSNSRLYMEADSVFLLGSLYAGGNPGRVLLEEEPGIDWDTAAATDAAIEIQAVEMVTFGGDDVNGATDLDVVLGFAGSAGETITRGGSAQATGTILISVSGGIAPLFELNELSYLKTDAVVIDDPTPGAMGHITVTTDRGIQIHGVIQAVDPDSDVTLDSGSGELKVTGFVEAGNNLSLTGADALSGEARSVVVDKLFYETKTFTFPTIYDATLSEAEFIVDEHGQPIDEYGFLLERDADGNVIVDVDGNPSRVVTPKGFDRLGEGPVYITYVDDGDDETPLEPVLVDKEGYLLVEYMEIRGQGPLPESGFPLSGIVLDFEVRDATTGEGISSLPLPIPLPSAATLIADINTALAGSDYSMIEAFERGGRLVLSATGYDIAIGDLSENLADLGLDDFDTYIRYLHVDEGTEGVDRHFLDDSGMVINEQGQLLAVGDVLINRYGYLIDEYGNFVDGSGNPIDAYGRQVDIHGNLIADDGVTLIDDDGNTINKNGLLINGIGELLNEVGAIRGTFDEGGTLYLVDRYDNLVSDLNELILEDSGTYYLINFRGEFVDEFGVPLTALEDPVEARGAPVIVTDPASLEAPVPGGDPVVIGSIQLGPDPIEPIGGKKMIDLPARQSGGTLNTTGPGGTITITGGRRIEIYGMVGRVKMVDADPGPDVDEVSTVDVTAVTITTPDEVYFLSDALVNARDSITVEGTNVWAMGESVTITRDDYSVTRLEATGTGPDDGKVYIARSQIYYFRALVAAQGAVELVGENIGVYGTVQVQGEYRMEGSFDHSLAQIDAEADIMVRGEVLSGGDVQMYAGTEGVTVGNIAVSAEGRVSAGYGDSMVAGDITMDASGEVILQAFEDTMNDDLEFAPAYITYEPVYVNVVTGYRRVEAGFVMLPVVHWIPTITTEQTGFDDVKVGSEFGSVETRLFQDGYYKIGFGMVDLHEDYGANPAFAAYWLQIFGPGADSAIHRIWKELRTSTQNMLAAYVFPNDPSTALKQALIDDFNAIVAGGTSLYDKDAFEGRTLSTEARSLIARDELSDVELSRLNRLIIQELIYGVRELPREEQFREYFIPEVDYETADLDWPGKWRAGYYPVYVAWLNDGAGRVVLPDDNDIDARITHQIFEKVVNFEFPVDPEIAYVQGTIDRHAAQQTVMETAVFDMLDQSQQQLFYELSPATRYTEHTFMEVHDMLHDLETQAWALQAAGFEVWWGSEGAKDWDDLTDTERINAILDFMGYRKLFDMQFISAFEKTYPVGVAEPLYVAKDPAIYDLLNGITRDDPIADGLTYVTDAAFQFHSAADGKTVAAGDGMAMYEVTDGRWVFSESIDTVPMASGVVYEHDGSDMFVPGLWVEDAFMVTPIALAASDAIFDMNVTYRTETKHYFDFWFSEFVPFDPAVHRQPWHGSDAEAARAHFMPPNVMLNEAFSGITQPAVQAELDKLDPMQTVPDDLFVGGELAMSAEYAADFAAIRRSEFNQDGVYMTKEVGQAIYNLIVDAIDAIADDFFIAGYDYDWRYSHPDQEPHYKASFFEREDAILSRDLDGHRWDKIYSPTEGLGRINRNFEGIPTATFWDLDFSGTTRDVVYYQLDDGTDIFIRVPVDWWENYEMTTLGNDRTDPDDKTLQYVGDVNTDDETVGYARNVAQLQYTQAWSDHHFEVYPPVDAVPGDWWLREDFDASRDRYVVSYREDPHPAWADDYTAYTQYSIFDGREIYPAEPYVDLMFYAGLVELYADFSGITGFEEVKAAGIGDAQAVLPLGTDLVFTQGLQLSDQLYYAVVQEDRSVKVAWTPTDWDLDEREWDEGIGDVVHYGNNNGDDGTLFFEDDDGNIYQIKWGDYYRSNTNDPMDTESGDHALPVANSGGHTVFAGNNWNFGYDSLGNAVFAQHPVGDDTLNLEQPGTRVELIASDGTRWVANVGRHNVLTNHYYVYNPVKTYTWQDAQDDSPAHGHLVEINSPEENDFVRSFIVGDTWLGGKDVWGTSHATWRDFKWDWSNQTVTRTGGLYHNFHPNEPNDWNGEDHLMMWPSGYWNDLDGSREIYAVWEVESFWDGPFVNGELYEDYVYKMKTAWDPILDIRSDITYRVFTEAHDIVDKRPRYETLTSEVPVIKYEQVTDWELVPVLEKQIDWSGSAVTPDGPLELAAFDLDTLTATGNITIIANGDVLVKAGMNASGAESAIDIESEQGDVTVGGEMPLDPMIYDMINITATKAVEITADGNVLIGETATLTTTSADEPVPLETDIAITATEGEITIAGEIHARHSVEISAGTDVTITGIITAADSTIGISAGQGATATGSITVHHEVTADPADDLDPDNERESLGGTLETLGDNGQIRLQAGTGGGDISLLDADIRTHTLTLNAPAGSVVQSSGYGAGDEETPPSTGGLLLAQSALVVEQSHGIILENIYAASISAVSSSGAITINAVGFDLVDLGEGPVPVWPPVVTLADIQTTSGPITIETITDYLVIANVASLSGATDDDITITARPAGPGGVVVEIGDIHAAGDADVILTVEGTIVDPGTSIVADQAEISAFGDIGADSQRLNTELNSLILEISGNGDLFLNNASAAFTLEEVVLANGSVDVTTNGDLLAKKIVLKTDWDVTDEPPSANQIILRTAEDSGGTITVVDITGGVYAADDAQAAEIRLRLLNAMLAKIDLDGDPEADPPVPQIPPGDIPDELRDPLIDEEGNEILDKNGELIIVVHLEMDEANDLAAIIAGALAAVDPEVDPYVLDEADFSDGTLPYMTGHVAFSLYLELLDALGVIYEASFEDDETPAWDHNRSEYVFSETTDLLGMTKGFTSQGKVLLEADGAIVGPGTGSVGIVAGDVTLIAEASITGLEMAVNTMTHVESISRAAISLFDVDGVGEATPGAELMEAIGGAITIATEGGFVLNNAHSIGSPLGMTLASTAGSMFIRETGSSLISDGPLNLNAAGDLTVTGHLVTPGQLSFVSGGSLTTFNQEVLLEIGSIAMDVGSSATLSGHISGLSAVNATSGGNVNLMEGAVELVDGKLVGGHKGFNVYVPFVAEQQTILNDMQDNLRRQARIVSELALLETALASRKLGQHDSVELLKADYLNQLMRLPHQVQAQQLQLQFAALQTLLEVQAPLPDTMMEMSVDIGGGQILTYPELLTQRTQVLGEIALLEGLILEANEGIAAIDGDNAPYIAELQLVEQDIGGTTAYLGELGMLRAAVDEEIVLRGDGFSLPDAAGRPNEVRNVDDLNLAYLNTGALGDLTNDQLGYLFLNLESLDQEVDQTLISLQTQKQSLNQLIVDHQGDYVTYDVQLPDVQADIIVYEGQLDDLDAQITNLQAVVDAIDAFLALSGYLAQDPAARDLAAYISYFTEDTTGMINGLIGMRPYVQVQADLSRVSTDLNNAGTVLGILQGMYETDYTGLDARLRELDAFRDVTLGTLGVPLVTNEMAGVVRTVTEDPHYNDVTYAALQADLAAINSEIARFQTVLDIVDPMVDALDKGEWSYTFFDTELRRLAAHGEYVISELWPHVQAMTNSNTLVDIDRKIDSINAKLDLVEKQFLNVALLFLDDMGALNDPKAAYDYLEGALGYTDNILVKDYGYKPVYDTPTPMSEKYEAIRFNTREGHFELLPDRLRVPWEYFDIVDVLYGPDRLELNLYDLNPEIISKMNEDQLLELRADLMTSWGKGDKRGIADGKYAQYGDLRFSYNNLVKQGATGELDPKLPGDREGCLKAITELEGNLAVEEGNRSTLIGHIDASIIRGQSKDSLIDRQQIKLDDAISDLGADRKIVESDIAGLEAILDDASYELAEMGVLFAEESRLLTHEKTLRENQGTYTTERGNIESHIDLIAEMVNSERDDLVGQRDTLTGQRNDLDLTYQAALVQEADLTATLADLSIELSDLNQGVSDHQSQITTFEGELGNLAALESSMRVELEAIVTQKWTERFDLYDVDLVSQEVEADILLLAQSLVVDQGAARFTGLAEASRNSLVQMEEKMTLLSGQFATLQSEHLLLQEQLQALQLTAPETTSITIQARGRQLSGLVQSEANEQDDSQIIIGPIDGIRVAQDEFAGYYLYRNTVTGQRLFRDVKGLTGEIGAEGDPVYIEDNADDNFYTWIVQLEEEPPGSGTWYYRDINGTPEDPEVFGDETEDDHLYEVILQGGVPGAIYPGEVSFTVKQLQIDEDHPNGTTTTYHDEIRLDDNGQKQTIRREIVHDLYTVNDYHYSIFIAVADPADPDPLDPAFDWDNAEIYVLDPTNGTAVSLAAIALEQEKVVWDDPDTYVLSPWETLDDLGVDLDRDDVLIDFNAYTPVYTPLAMSAFTFVDPEAEYTDKEFQPEETLPTLYTEVLHNGQLVVPVIVPADGMINFEGVSFSATDILTIIAPEGVTGIEFGDAFTAREVNIQSDADLRISGSVIGIDLVRFEISGDLYLDAGALVDAATVEFISETGSVYGAEGSMVTGDRLVADVFGDFSIFADFSFYDILSEFGIIWIDDFDYGIDENGWDYGLGSNDGNQWAFTDKVIDLTRVFAGSGTVTVASGGTMRARDVAANDITLIARGAGSIELGQLETWASTISLDAARYVRDISGETSNVIAGDVAIAAGLDVTSNTGMWPVELLQVRSNLSVLIDEFYTGPWQIGGEMVVQRDIIVDTVITTDEDVRFDAGRDIIFTDNGGIQTTGQTMLGATDSLVFTSPAGNMVVTPVIQGTNVFFEAFTIVGGENALISADFLAADAVNGFNLFTDVTLLRAKVSGRGDLNVNARSSIALDGVDVFDGDLKVASGGAINARNVIIETDSYANTLALSAVGEVLFGGEPLYSRGGQELARAREIARIDTDTGKVLLGQLVEVDIQAGGGYAAIDDQVRVLPFFRDEIIRAGQPTDIRILVEDPYYRYVPAPGTHTVEVEIDFGDGSPVMALSLPYVEPDPVLWDTPSRVLMPLKGDSEWLFRHDMGDANSVSVGDVNGDGYDDLLVGETAYDQNTFAEIGSRVVLYLGSASGLIEEKATIIYGSQPEGRFGQIIAPAGDVNNDGYDDVLIAGPAEQVDILRPIVNPDGTVSYQSDTVQGALYLFRGTPDGLSPKPAWRIADLKTSGQFRFSMASAGDVNNDGFSDVLVGVSAADTIQDDETGKPQVLSRAGMAYLYLGSADGLSETPAWTYSGGEADGMLGSSVSAIGDLNGDGFDDVLVGACRENTMDGRVYVFLGSGKGLAAYPFQELEGVDDGWFGWDAVGVGDINNDGSPDIIVSAPFFTQIDPAFSRRGAVYAYFGTTDGFVTEPQYVDVPEDLISGFFGWDLAPAGDVNNDGFSDFLALSATSAGDVSRGQAFLYLGSPDGVSPMIVRFPEGKAGSVGFDDIPGALAGGDFNNDGFNDVVLGDWARYDFDTSTTISIYNGNPLDYPAPVIAQADVVHTYDTAGTFTLSAGVVGADGTRSVGGTSETVHGDPVAVDDELVTDEDTQLTIVSSDLLRNDQDPDIGDILTIISIDTSGMLGQLLPDPSGNYVYDPNGQFETLAAGESTVDTFSYMVSDGQGGEDTATVTVTVTGVNDAPTIEVIDPINVAEGSTITQQIQAGDVDGIFPLTYSLVDAPDWAAIDAETGMFTATPPDGPQDSVTITVRVTDGEGAAGTVTFDLTVQNVAPGVAADQAAVTVNEGDPAANTGTFSDPGADVVTLIASVGTVVDNGDGTWSWSLATTDGPDQNQTVTITAEDDDGAVTTTTFELQVDDVAPVFEISGDSTVTVGEKYTLDLIAIDPGDDPVTSWLIDWGDGTQETIDGDLSSASHIYLAPKPLPGDFDGDGVVSRRDRSVFRANFGQSGENLPGDFDGDGVVSRRDRSVFRANFGSSGWGTYRISVTAIDEDGIGHSLDPLDVMVTP
jgi:VCBS repeat-containing protein